jgi:hypothetical protein
MIHTLFPNKVQLEPVSHKYYDGEGKQYISVSKVLSLLSEKFEDTIAYARASDETRAEWKKKGKDAADHGTNIHNALELYNKTGQILIENAHLEEAIKSIIGEYKEYHQSHDEVCLYNEEYRIAGTTDKICVLSNRKDSDVDLADFKTNISKGIYYYSDYKKRLFSPFDHLQDCNYVKYSFQLSIYAYFFECLTGRRVRQLYIHFIPPHDMLQHKKIPVMYMKNDVKLLLETYRYQILSLLEGEVMPAF